MFYRNDSIDAILSLERARTGNYGEDYESEFWGECEDDLPNYYDSEDDECDEYMLEVRGLI